MTTFTELVATVVVHSSAVALSHFGVTLEPTDADKAQPPAAERVVSRSHSQVQPQQHKVLRLTSCPRSHQASTIKV